MSFSTCTASRSENNFISISSEEHRSKTFVSACEKGLFLERIVTEIINKLGIPANVKGYRYLRSAVVMAADDPELAESITKKLYPAVAAQYCATPARVERNIRHAICCAWEKRSGDTHAAEELLHCPISYSDDPPTNSELIALMSDSIRLSYSAGQ